MSGAQQLHCWTGGYAVLTNTLCVGVTLPPQGNQSLAIPHLSVPDISWIDWKALKEAGFKACVFDKDNTLCEPFALAVPAQLLPSFQQCQAAFGPSKLVLYSNSAGLQQYDPQGEEAASLERAFGVHVLRHKDKKPAGGCQELQEYCG